MTEYQNQLVSDSMGIVDWVIRHRIQVVNLPLLWYEDFYQVGCEALCKAAMAYDPKVGEFAPFASTIVYNALIDHCRKEKNGNRSAIDIQTLNDSDHYIFSYLCEENDLDSSAYGKELMQALEESKTRYSGIVQRGIEAIELKSLGYSANEIAEHYGTSINNLNAWISRARQRLKKDGLFLKVFS